MSDQVLQRLGRLLLLCCVLTVATATGWGSFAYMAWSARELSQAVSTLAAQRDQLVLQRNAMGAELEQLHRTERERASSEAKIPAAGSQQLFETGESAAANGDITALDQAQDGSGA